MLINTILPLIQVWVNIQPQTLAACPKGKGHQCGHHINMPQHRHREPLNLADNKTILMPEVDHCLLCPMQYRMNGVEINEVPKFLTSRPTTSTHSITIADSTEDVHLYTIRLQIEGVLSYFEYSLATSAKFEVKDIPHLELMMRSPASNPGFCYSGGGPPWLQGTFDLCSKEWWHLLYPEDGDKVFHEDKLHWKLSQVSP